MTRKQNETIRKSNCLYVNVIRRFKKKFRYANKDDVLLILFFFFCLHYYDIYHKIYEQTQTHIIIDPYIVSSYNEQVKCSFK